MFGFQSYRCGILYFTYTQPLGDTVAFFLSYTFSASLVASNFCNRSLLSSSVQIRVIFMLKLPRLITDFSNY